MMLQEESDEQKDYRNCQKHSKKTPTYHCALKLMSQNNVEEM